MDRITTDDLLREIHRLRTVMTGMESVLRTFAHGTHGATVEDCAALADVLGRALAKGHGARI